MHLHCVVSVHEFEMQQDCLRSVPNNNINDFIRSSVIKSNACLAKW
jgi:hypothetical protein